MGWITELTNWLDAKYQDFVAWLDATLESIMQWFADAFESITEFWRESLHDLLLALLDLVLRVAETLIYAIPAPTFLEGYSLNSLFAQGGPWVAWIVGQLALGECLAVIGAAYSFRLVRKVVTFGRW